MSAGCHDARAGGGGLREAAPPRWCVRDNIVTARFLVVDASSSGGATITGRCCRRAGAPFTAPAANRRVGVVGNGERDGIAAGLELLKGAPPIATASSLGRSGAPRRCRTPVPTMLSMNAVIMPKLSPKSPSDIPRRPSSSYAR